ncbi:MAG: DoxX family protein [Planctomycetaceae bacterium]|nr:DoxX family protein [Planctomycetaceae bacterium]
MSVTPETVSAPPSKVARWCGWILTVLIIVANLMGAGMNLSGNADAVKGAAEVGYPANTLFGIGIALVICAIVFAVPRTAILGALLLTGYMGGAGRHTSAQDRDGARLCRRLFSRRWCGSPCCCASLDCGRCCH